MNINETKLNRRGFLTGAATAIGATIATTTPGAAQAFGVVTMPTKSVVDLYYWNGRAFVSPLTLTSGLEPQVGLQVTILGFGAHQNLKSIDVNFPGGKYFAYTGGPSGAQAVTFGLPYSPKQSLNFTVNHAVGSSTMQLSSGSNSGMKLQLGTYLLVEHGVNPNSLVLSGTDVVVKEGVSFSQAHILITVSPK